METKWVYCPICHHKTRTKIRPDTVMQKFPVFCPVCKNETVIDVKNLKIELSQ